MLEIVLTLDTDTPEGLRVNTNDNLLLLTNQLNQFLNYLNSDFGTLTSLTNLETTELKVNTNKLIVTPTSFTINSNVQLTGNLNINGKMINSSMNSTIISSTLQEVIDNGGEYNIGSTSTYPVYNTYQVTSSDSSGLIINLFPGANGQELYIVMVNDPSGIETFVDIQKSISGTAEFYLPSGNTVVTLGAIGESVLLQYIIDGWYVKSSTGTYN